jgi:hypothetical protein
LMLSPLAAPLQLFRFASVASTGDNRQSYYQVKSNVS